jgi:Tol biopolymer transport system component
LREREHGLGLAIECFPLDSSFVNVSASNSAVSVDFDIHCESGNVQGSASSVGDRLSGTFQSDKQIHINTENAPENLGLILGFDQGTGQYKGLQDLGFRLSGYELGGGSVFRDNLGNLSGFVMEISPEGYPEDLYAISVYGNYIQENTTHKLYLSSIGFPVLPIIQMTDNAPLYKSDLNWSPDGSSILFVSGAGKEREISKVDIESSEQILLTQNDQTDDSPLWSPDGLRIAFESQRDGNNEIYVMNADGTEQTRLTHSDASDYGPAWSPDGMLIAFTSRHDRGRDIYVVGADGANLTRVVAGGFSPVWSPDGSRIAYQVFASDGSGADIYVSNANGTNPIRLVDKTYVGMSDPTISWSPDGAYLLFISEIEDNREIYMMNADGANQVQLTSNSVDEYRSYWSPDGEYIAFIGNSLWMMRYDGSEQRRLTPFSVSYASWSPDGRRIAFTPMISSETIEIYILEVDELQQEQ